jgi:hypothetical protein
LITSATVHQREASILQRAVKQHPDAGADKPKTNQQHKQIADANVEPSLDVPSQILIQIDHCLGVLQVIDVDVSDRCGLPDFDYLSERFLRG